MKRIIALVLVFHVTTLMAVSYPIVFPEEEFDVLSIDGRVLFRLDDLFEDVERVLAEEFGWIEYEEELGVRNSFIRDFGEIRLIGMVGYPEVIGYVIYSEALATRRGITVGSTYQEIIDAYGLPLREPLPVGFYSYRRDRRLVFQQSLHMEYSYSIAFDLESDDPCAKVIRIVINIAFSV